MRLRISLLAAVLCMTVSTATGDRVWFVDEGAPGRNSGSGWEDAFVDLQDALAAAEPGDDIRVAQGVYKPTDVPGDRLATFRLGTGVAVEGGYAGFGERDPDRRDVTAYETTLSCDINDDDVRLGNGLIEQNQENCHHVVTGSGTDESAVIEGFTIRGGNANGCDFPHYHGGGMLNVEGSPTVARCRFIHNSGGFFHSDCPGLSGQTEYGAGGMYNNRAHPTVTDCAFHQNVGLDFCGGMQNVQSSPTVTGCTFTENTSFETSRGGAILSQESDTTLIDCRFERHRTGAVAAGTRALLVRCVFDGNVPQAFSFSAGRATLTDCVFSGNGEFGRPVVEVRGADAVLTRCRFDGNRSLALQVVGSVLEIRDSEFVGNENESGTGGIRAREQSDLTIVGCMFNDNMSSHIGGAIFQDTGELTIVDSGFDGNWAEDAGGGVVASRALVTIERCIFLNNCASKAAGADAVDLAQSQAVVSNSLFAYNRCAGAFRVGSQSIAEVTNCTFADNRTFGGMAAGLSAEEGTAVVSNCILYGNRRGEERDESAQIDNRDGLLSINYSCVEGWTGNLGGTGNIGDDPRFVDPDGGDHRLLPGSPVIDVADNTTAPPPIRIDLDGNPRFVDDPDTEDAGRGTCPIVDMGAYEFQVEGGCCLRLPRWVCDGDVDGDGQVNPVDSGLVEAAFGSSRELALCNYDVDCDGQINPVDSGIVQSLFGTCEAPRAACP